jgi:hypothetical protein
MDKSTIYRFLTIFVITILAYNNSSSVVVHATHMRGAYVSGVKIVYHVVIYVNYTF